MKKYLVILTLLINFSVFAQQLPNHHFTDQWDKPVVLDEQAKVVIFTNHRKGGDWTKEALSELGVTDLSEKNWVYVADISKMPSMITKLFALPAMRDYAFSIALDKDGKTTIDWVHEKDSVSVYHVNHLAIDKVKHFKQKQDLKAYLQGLLAAEQ